MRNLHTPYTSVKNTPSIQAADLISGTAERFTPLQNDKLYSDRYV